MEARHHQPHERRPRLRSWLVALALVGATTTAHAASPLAALPVAEPSDLEAVRGGFIGADGLHVSFSLQHLVNVDGQLEAHSHLQLPLSSLSGSSAEFAELLRQNAMLSVAADGSNVTHSGLNTLIQNHLDGRAIENLRIFDIELGGLQRTAPSATTQLQPHLVHALR